MERRRVPDGAAIMGGSHSISRGAGRRAGAMVATLAMAGGLLVVGPLSEVAHATATFVVASTGNQADANAGDGICASTVGSGSLCTLRAAIQEANALAGTDTINFSLAPSTRINLTTALPAITQPAVIDGTTATVIRLDGAGNNPAYGFKLDPGSGGSTIKGFSISRTGSAVLVESDGNTIAGNYLGLLETSNASCSSPVASCANSVGVEIVDASNNTIGGTTVAARNVVSNNNYGVWIRSNVGSPNNNVVRGNYIGTDGTGALARPNSYGIHLVGGLGNTIGGTAAGARNVIAGNGSYGVYLGNSGAPSTDTSILGNYIGVTAGGVASLANYWGVYIEANNSGTTIGGSAAGAGNVISGNSESGVFSPGGSDITIAGNRVGTTADGLSALPNQYGIYSYGGGDITVGGPTTAHRNLISGNSATGLYIQDNGIPTDATVRNNYIGTDATGTADLGNNGAGLQLSNVDGLITENVVSGNGSHNVQLNGCPSCTPALGAYTVSDNIIGLAAGGAAQLSNPNPATYGGNSYGGLNLASTRGTVIDGNVVSSHPTDGVYFNDVSGATVIGNRVGTNAAGTAVFGNASAGISANSTYDSDFGQSGAGNLVSGNEGYGLFLSAADSTSVQGNLIGTNAAGTAALGSQPYGIFTSGSDTILLGGSAGGEGNVVVGTTSVAMYLSATDHSTVVGNQIGVASNDTTPIPNLGEGVYLESGSDRNTIGGTAAGEGNHIANSGSRGVFVGGAVSNDIRGNRIHDSVGLGIDLGGSGVSANDNGDADGGSNRYQNFPVLTQAAANGTTTQVQGTLNSHANRTYALDFFTNPTCSSLGNGEGRTYLGSSSVTTNGSGNVTFLVNLPAVAAFNSAVTATATDTVLNDTSEFSACTTASSIPTASISPTAPSVSEGAGTVNLTVNLSSAPTFTPVTVDYATAFGTAGASDFTATSGTVTFGVGETSKPINVTLNSDALDEDNESFTVTLSNASNTVIATGGGTSTVTITDDDVAPSLSIADPANVTEGNTGTTNQTYTITLSAPSAKTVTVIAATAAGTATPNVDYTTGANVVTFNPGDTVKTFAVAIIGDTLDENNENLVVNLLSPSNATVADGQATGIIADNDSTPTIVIDDVTVTEGDSGSANATFTLTISKVSGRVVRATLSTANNTATSPTDYTPRTNFSVYIQPGATTATFTVAVKGDTDIEPNESFFVNIVAMNNGANIADGQGVGTITNDDP